MHKILLLLKKGEYGIPYTDFCIEMPFIPKKGAVIDYFSKNDNKYVRRTVKQVRHVINRDGQYERTDLLLSTKSID